MAALRHHQASTFFLRADIDNFFGRVNRSRVTRCLKTWFSYTDAREMASESVVKKPGTETFVLPYGFVQSPALASLALNKSKLGSYLRQLNRRKDLRVSVYVDDLIISANDERVLGTVAEDIVRVADEAFFPLSATKTEGPAREVSAFNIYVSNRSLRISDERLEELCQNYRSTASDHSKAGIRSYVDSVNPAQSSSL